VAAGEPAHPAAEGQAHPSAAATPHGPAASGAASRQDGAAARAVAATRTVGVARTVAAARAVAAATDASGGEVDGHSTHPAPELRELLDAIEAGRSTVSELAEGGRDPLAVLRALTELEVGGFVRRGFGGRYIRAA
jgi:predicted transcriptional regulator